MRESLFSIGFIRYSSDLCSCSVEQWSSMGPHTLRPWGTLFSHWFCKGSLVAPPVPSWRIQQHHFYLGDATFHFGLFSNGFPPFLANYVGLLFFGQADLAGNRRFYKGFEGFWAPGIFGQDYSAWSLKAQLFSCYMFRNIRGKSLFVIPSGYNGNAWIS